MSTLDDDRAHPVGSRAIPTLSLVLGYGPMLPFVGGAVLAWLTAGDVRRLFLDLALLWGCLILAFLSGVRRGASFLTEGGPRPIQIATMLWLFCLAGLALLASSFGWPRVALIVLALGYASVGALDPGAAARGEVPAFFRRLRPFQMAIPVLAFLALLPLAG